MTHLLYQFPLKWLIYNTISGCQPQDIGLLSIA